MPSAPVTAPLLALLAGCVHLAAPAAPRPPLPLPAERAAAWSLPGEGAEESLVPAGRTEQFAYYRGALRCGPERATFHLLQPRLGRPAPLVLCLPILAGGADLMWHIASDMAERGFAALWADRVASALRGGQSAPELDALFARTLLHNRMLLRWAERQPHRFAPGGRALIGVSMGGILGSVLLALEPGLVAAALCLAGGDLPDLLLASREHRVATWREARRRADGLAGRTLREELARELRADPVDFGRHVATERVLLVQAGLDQVVPARHQDALWESLGRPRRLRLPLLGHYSAALALDAILDEIAGFFRHRLRAAAAGRPRRQHRPGGRRSLARPARARFHLLPSPVRP